MTLSLQKNIAEGGAAGHLQHVHEDLDITFAKLKRLLISVNEGSVESVSEKVDGMNLVFSVVDGEVRVARNGGDIASGGIGYAELRSRFASRGAVKDAFTGAFETLAKFVSKRSKKSLDAVFEGGTLWFSAEVVSAANVNVIPYTSDAVIVHETPVFVRIDGEKAKKLASHPNARLAQKLMNSSSNMTITSSPIDRVAVSHACQALDDAAASVGLKGSDSLRDYVRESISRSEHDAIARYAAGEITAAAMNAELRAVGLEHETAARCAALRAAALEPIDDIIRSFAVSVLSKLRSTLVSDSDKAIAQMRERLTNAISRIESAGDAVMRGVLRQELAKLPSRNISAAIEGIVFISGGKAYKMTGAFLPVQKILSLAKSLPAERLSEGGKAFKNVSRVSKSIVSRLWPGISETLASCGVTASSIVGSAGKRESAGDIDVSFEGVTSQRLSKALARKLGADNVSVHGKTVSFLISDDDGSRYQVDAFPGEGRMSAWGRWSPSDDASSDEYSPVKGVVRNLLLNSVALVSSEISTGSDTRDRVTIDFDAGLMRVSQRRIGGRWVTTSSGLVTSDPDDIATELFGAGFSARDITKFEDVARAVTRSRETHPIQRAIFHDFMRSLRSVSESLLGADAAATIAYCQSVIDE